MGGWSPYFRPPPPQLRSGSGRRGRRAGGRGVQLPLIVPVVDSFSNTRKRTKENIGGRIKSRRLNFDVGLDSGTMGSFGNTRQRLRPKYRKLGRDKAWKHRAMNEDPIIYRMVKANELDIGHGFNTLKFSHKTPGELPLWLCDLTTFYHTVRDVSTASPGTAFDPKPWWKLNLTKTAAHVPGSTHDSVSFESIDYSYNVEWAKQPADGAVPANYKNQILKWIDFRGMFYGCNNRDVDWDIRVVRITNPALHVVPEMDLSGAPPTTQQAKDSLAERRLFWSEMVRKFTANPILPGAKVDFKRAVKTVWKQTIHIPAKENTVTALNSKHMKVFLRLNRLLNYGWRHTNTTIDDATAYGFMNDPTQLDATDRSADAYVKPEGRLYLLIRATCPVDSSDADRTYAEGYTMFNKADAAVGLTNTYDASGGALGSGTLTNTGAGVPTMLPALVASIDHNTTGTFAGSNIFAFKKGPVGTVITTGEAIGMDNPTFDFVLRAKLIEASR